MNRSSINRRLFLNKNAGLQSWNFIKKWLQHRFFPVNIAKFLRAPVLENICEWLFNHFLHEQVTYQATWELKRTFSQKQNMGIEEDIFSKTKHGNEEDIFSKTKKNIQNLARRKNLPFHDALDHFVYLYISTACLRPRLPYIIKRWSSWRTLKQLNQWGTSPGPMENYSLMLLRSI